MLFNIDKDLRLNPGHTCSGNVVTLNEYKYYNHIFLNSIEHNQLFKVVYMMYCIIVCIYTKLKCVSCKLVGKSC